MMNLNIFFSLVGVFTNKKPGIINQFNSMLVGTPTWGSNCIDILKFISVPLLVSSPAGMISYSCVFSNKILSNLNIMLLKIQVGEDTNLGIDCFC